MGARGDLVTRSRSATGPSTRDAALRASKKRVSKSSRKTLEFAATFNPKTAVQGYLRQKSGASWTKKWYILHDRYLSSMKRKPRTQAEFQELVQGSINLWSVNEVEVDGCDIVINMGDRKRTESAQAAAPTRSSTWVARAYSLFGKDEIVLRAEDEDTAQRWVQAMFAGPFAGQARQAFDGEGSSVTGLSIPEGWRDAKILETEASDSLQDPGLGVHRLRLTLSRKSTRKPLFETKRLYGTRMGVGKIPSSARVQVDMTRIGRPLGMITSRPISAYPTTSDGAIRVVLLDPDMMRDGVLVLLRRDALHSLRSELDAIVVSVIGVIGAVLSAGLVSLIGVAPGLFASCVIHFAALLGAVYMNRDATILEHAGIIPLQEALAVDLVAERNHYASSGSSRRSVRRRSSRRASVRRASKGPDDGADEDEDDEDELGPALVSPQDIGDGVELTVVEETLLAELRQRVVDLIDPRKVRDPYALAVYERYINEDYRLLRFLRARNLNLRKAERLLRVSLAWRIEYRASEIHKEFDLPQWMLEYFGSPDIIGRIENNEDRLPWYFRDEGGQLAVFLRVGRLNHRLMFRKLGNDGEKLFRAGVWLFEMILQDLEAHFESSGRSVPPQISIVMDLEGFQMSKQLPVNQALSLARRYVGKLLDGYPEVLSHVTVVNAPWLFNSLWTMFQPFFPERVLNKIWIGGSNAKACHNRIRKIHHPDQTPVFYGGTVKEGDDIYCSFRVPCQGPFLSDEGASLLAP